MKTYDVFISHASQNSDLAGTVCARLEADGLRCWIAPRDIPPGKVYTDAIAEAIGICPMMIVVLTSQANASDHVRNEVELAVQNKVKIITFRAESIDLSPSLLYHLKSRQWVDGTLSPDTGLIKGLTELLRIAPEANDGPDFKEKVKKISEQLKDSQESTKGVEKLAQNIGSEIRRELATSRTMRVDLPPENQKSLDDASHLYELVFKCVTGDANESIRRFQTDDKIFLGRALEADLRLYDTNVSKMHACVVLRLSETNGDKQPWILDLLSGNGTEVNGSRLTGPRLLAAGDLIRLGQQQVEFVSIKRNPETGRRALGRRVIIPSSSQRPTDAGASKPESAAPRERMYKDIFIQANDGGIIADSGGQILEANIRAMDLLLFESQEMQSLRVPDIISGAGNDLVEELHVNLEQTPCVIIQACCIRKDGSSFPAEITVNRLLLPDQNCLCLFIRDITSLKQTEAMLLATHNAIQNAAGGIAFATLEWRLEYVNPAMCALWGYGDAAELIGMSVCDLLTDAQAASEALTGAMESRQSWTGEMRGRRKDGAEFDVQVSAVSNRNAEGETVGLVVSFIDISDKKKVEDALREAERHRVMLESLGAACHHLGRPATVLLANLGIMQRKVGAADQDLSEILKSSVEAAEMLGDMLHRLSKVNE